MVRLLTAALLVSLVMPDMARAHFLFVRILPPAEGGRFAEVYFSEYAQAGDPRFVSKIVSTQLWLQTAPGEFQPLEHRATEDRLRVLLPSTHPTMIVGSCTYGVLQRKVPFLLRHFPKAMAGDPEKLKALKPFSKVPLEIVGVLEDGSLRLTARLDGKPMPGVEFNTVARDLSGIKFKAGADGSALWKPSKSGTHAVYISHFHKTPGKLGDQKYDEVRDFATLSFTWPLVPTADDAATKLFDEAIKARASWQNFHGFSANIAGQIDGRPFKGTAAIDAQGTVALTLDDDALQPWAEDTLSSLAMHRTGSAAPSKLAYRFADEDDNHPLGRLLVVEGGRFASSYRVKDRQIVVVNRLMGKENMTILVQDNDRNKEGQFLPRGYTVQYWDAATGKLNRTDTIQQRWQRVGNWDLPTQHVETRSSASGVTVRSFVLSGHALKK